MSSRLLCNLFRRQVCVIADAFLDNCGFFLIFGIQRDWEEMLQLLALLGALVDVVDGRFVLVLEVEVRG